MFATNEQSFQRQNRGHKLSHQLTGHLKHEAQTIQPQPTRELSQIRNNFGIFRQWSGGILLLTRKEKHFSKIITRTHLGDIMNTAPINTKDQKKPLASIILYHLLSFPLAILYFVLTVTGLSLGAGTLIIWVGLPILIGSFAMIRGFGGIERSLARGMLGISIAEPRPDPNEKGSWGSALASLRSSLTWKCLLYVMIKFPLSVLMFCITLVFLTLSIGLILTPLGYLIATYVLQILNIHLVNNPPAWLFFTIDITGTFNGLEFLKTFLGTALGVGFWFLTQGLLRGCGRACGELARALLSPTEWETRQYEDQRNNEQFYQHTYERGYTQGYQASHDETRPRAVYQEQPEMPTQEMPFQYQRS
jgi:hypothetical protein